MPSDQDVEAIAMSLPEVSRVPGEFRFVVNEKAIVWGYMQRVEPKKPRVRNPDAVAIRVTDEWEKEDLIALNPIVFFTDDHYRGFPAVLVRLTHIRRDELDRLISNAWRLRAPKALVKSYEATM